MDLIKTINDAIDSNVLTIESVYIKSMTYGFLIVSRFDTETFETIYNILTWELNSDKIFIQYIEDLNETKCLKQSLEYFQNIQGLLKIV